MTQPADVAVTFNFNALHLGFSNKIGQILERATVALTSVAAAQGHGDPVPGVVLSYRTSASSSKPAGWKK
jgi:hypothetical protein